MTIICKTVTIYSLPLKIVELEETLSCESVFLSNAVSIGDSLELTLGDSGSGEATA